MRGSLRGRRSRCRQEARSWRTRLGRGTRGPPVYDVRGEGLYDKLWAMRFDLVTIFPEFFAGPFEHGIVRRAREAGIAEIHVQDLRAFTKDRHKTVADRPFGGGEGMVLKPEPLFEAVESPLVASGGPAL